MGKFLHKFIGNKAFYKELLIVAVPIALQQFVSAAVNALDTIMVGQYDGSSATAAVAVANRYFNSFNAIIIAIAVSCSVFIAQFYGAKRHDKLREMFGLNIILCVTFSLISFLVGFIWTDQIIEFFTGTVSEELGNVKFRQYGIDYLHIVVFSFIPLAFTNALTFTYRPLRMTSVPLISAIAAAVTNGVLNLILINGLLGFPAMAVKGAAIATLISRLVELAILVIYFYWKKPAFYGKIKELFKIPKSLIIAVYHRAKPLVFAQFLTEAMIIFMFFVYSQIEKGDPSTVAAITVTQQMTDIVVTLVGGMGTAASILVGARLGAGKFEEARENARWQLSYVFVFSIFAGLALVGLIPFSKELFGFTAEEQTLLWSIMILQAGSLPFLFYAINVIFITRSGGYTKAPIFISNVVYYCMKLPLIFLFVYGIPNIFQDSAILQNMMIAIGLQPTMVVFIFLLDRVIEVVRAIVAYFIYTKVNWWNNLNTTV